MKKRNIKSLKIFIISALIIILLLVLFFPYQSLNSNSNNVCIRSKCFKAELAETSEKHQKGLMFREYLDQNAGMLFIFEEEEIYPFWMKNTLIPLDIIWINKDKEIIYIEENVPPCKADPCLSYSPNKEALYVLETNANLAEKYSFKEGDKITTIIE